MSAFYWLSVCISSGPQQNTSSESILIVWMSTNVPPNSQVCCIQRGKQKPQRHSFTSRHVYGEHTHTQTLRYCWSMDSLSFLVLSESSGSSMILLRTTSRVKTPTLFWLSAQTGFPFWKNSWVSSYTWRRAKRRETERDRQEEEWGRMRRKGRRWKGEGQEISLVQLRADQVSALSFQMVKCSMMEKHHRQHKSQHINKKCCQPLQEQHLVKEKTVERKVTSKVIMS